MHSLSVLTQPRREVKCGWQVYGTKSREWSALEREDSKEGLSLEPDIPHGYMTSQGSFRCMNLSSTEVVLFKKKIYQHIVTCKLTNCLLLAMHLQKNLAFIFSKGGHDEPCRIAPKKAIFTNHHFPSVVCLPL